MRGENEPWGGASVAVVCHHMAMSLEFFIPRKSHKSFEVKLETLW